MPSYDYFCESNRALVEVSHDANVVLRNWGELCYVAGLQPGTTDPAAPVRKVLRSAPASISKMSNAELRAAGFTKLVKRDDGVYENVTAAEGEERYMRRGRSESMPHLHKKVRD